MSEPGTTDDIVEHLRNEGIDIHWGGKDGLFHRAADEIEKLRELLWMLQDQGYHPSGYLKDKIEAAVKYG